MVLAGGAGSWWCWQVVLVVLAGGAGSWCWEVVVIAGAERWC